MVDSPEEISRPRFIVETTPSSRLAWFRALMMLDRAIASWVLTAITLIGFGFTIVLLFDEFSRFTGVDPPIRPFAPFHFSLALIGLGVAVLVVAGWQYRAMLRYLRHGDFAVLAEVNQKPGQTAVYAVMIVALFIGVFSFLAVAARAL